VESRIEQGLSKTKKTWFSRLSRLFTEPKIDPAVWDDLEEALIGADVGLDLSEQLIERTRERVRQEGHETSQDLRGVLRTEMMALMGPVAISPPDFPSTALEIILVVGVNGSGKTTSVAKLAHLRKEQGQRVLLVAGDTFRTAAIDQLQIWGRRIGIDVIAHQPGADPGAVVFDGVQAARARDVDALIIDTAGRLQSKSNLMEELSKIHRVIEKALPDAPVHSLLVLDATTGQNGLSQAREFLKAVHVDAILLAKLDGTSKGGIVLAIRSELGVPISYIGTGEGIDDIAAFDPTAFVEALVG
jgi:fused signal recognition particle receptor